MWLPHGLPVPAAICCCGCFFVPIATVMVFVGFVPMVVFVGVMMFMGVFFIVGITAGRAVAASHLCELILSQLWQNDILSRRRFFHERKHSEFPFLNENLTGDYRNTMITTTISHTERHCFCMYFMFIMKYINPYSIIYIQCPWSLLCFILAKWYYIMHIHLIIYE